MNRVISLIMSFLRTAAGTAKKSDDYLNTHEIFAVVPRQWFVITQKFLP